MGQQMKGNRNGPRDVSLVLTLDDDTTPPLAIFC